MHILGLSCFYHDSAACLLRNGEILAAAQEERFSRKKHDAGFPIQAIRWCLTEAGMKPGDLDFVVFYEKPLLKFERILETAFSCAPFGIRPFIKAIPLWLKEKLWIPEIIRKELNYQGRILFSEHHESHAASSFYPSPFKKAAFLTMDGVGEWETTSFGIGEDNNLEILYTLRFPHSLGLLYSGFTYYIGFKVNSGEYKLMGLAPYGEPKYVNLILDNLLDLKPDGSFRLNMKYFGYCNGLRMTNANFDKLFGAKSRKPESKITQKHMDIAASIQKVTEEIMLRMARHVHQITGQDKLCLAGGVALNCVGNGRILREGLFKELWIQPAAGDAGAALGAALLVWHKYLGHKREADEKNDKQKASLLGPHYEDKSIEDYLIQEGIAHKRLDDFSLRDIVSGLLVQGKVIGWFHGRMEFGPRALGSRSIIGDARNPEMQSKMNLKIKYRESFRPFASTVLSEHASEWFELSQQSPYMLLTAPVREDKRTPIGKAQTQSQGFDRLLAIRSKIPAVTHVDDSARVQTIQRKDNPFYYDLIQAFYQKTGCPVLINTSFNVRGEPLVLSPCDAYTCFMRTEMDYLVLGPFLLDKKQQKQTNKDTSWQQVFELD